MTKIFKTKRAKTIFFISALAFSLTCIVLRTLAMLFVFETDIGYYKSESPLGLAASLLPTLCAVAAAVFCFIRPLKIEANAAKNTLSLRICFALFTVIFIIMTAFAAQSTAYGYSLRNILTVLFCVLSTLFFLLLTINKKTDSALYVISGIAVIAWLVMTLSESYFDSYVQMNSPIKLSFQFGVLAAMLLTVNEVRCTLNDNRVSFHLFSATVAAVFCGASSVPSVICSLMAKMPDNYYLFNYDCVLALFFVISIVRLAQMCFSCEALAPEAAQMADASDSDIQETQRETEEENV